MAEHVSERGCAICLSDFEAPARTPCGHLFCAECLRTTFKSRRPWNRGLCPLCRTVISLYDTIDDVQGTPLERPPVETIFGEVFLQGNSEGVAAYHFDDPSRCYISYAAAPDAWRLDNGERLPTEKDFADVAYDAATRTLTATVDWSASPLRGEHRWAYRMVFSDDFACISGGELKAYDADGRHVATHTFPGDLRYVRQRPRPTTVFGQSFVQGGQLGHASYHFERADSCYISYEAAPPSWRMDDGSSPPARKPFVDPSWDEATRTFTGAIDWSAATFGGDARWEYTVVFDDAFSVVSGGAVRAFNADGEPTDTHRFGRDLFYARYSEEIAQLRFLLSEVHGAGALGDGASEAEEEPADGSGEADAHDHDDDDGGDGGDAVPQQ